MNPQAGSRTPSLPVAPVLRLPPTPRIVLMAGRCAVWGMHLVLLGWMAGQLFDVRQGHAAWHHGLGAVALGVLMVVLWWRMPAVGGLTGERRLVPSGAPAQPHRWHEPGVVGATGLQAGARLDVLLDSGAGMLLRVREAGQDAITWVPADHLSPEIRWHLHGRGAEHHQA